MSPQQSIAHYRITCKLGEGGMGAVYRATDTKLNRDVAIKVLPPAFAEDGARMARFEREAQLLAALNHPNIAAIYGIEQGAIVMELVEGQELQGPLPCEIAVGYAAQIAAGLEAAHEKGVIHRDLKPANIKVTADGVIKLLDFGLAKVVEETAHSTAAGPTISPTLSIHMTQAGMILGTAAYMAPEQARGAAVDKRADIWAFGVVLMEMLTGRMPFRGETVSDTLAEVLRAPIDWSALPPDAPPAVRRLLERCLERDPKRRLRDIGEARIALSGSEVLAPAPPPPAAVVPRRHRLPWAAAGLGAAVALASIGLWVVQGRPAASGVTRFSISLPPGQVLTGGAPAVSRDGRTIVYTANGADGISRLYVRPLDSLESAEVPGSQGACCPFFSPDASRIGFFAGGKLLTASRGGGPPTAIADAGRYEVYIRSLAKPEDAVAVSSGGGSEPRWSPDGRELFFRRNNAFMAAGINLNSSGVVSVGEPRKLFDASAAWGRNPNHAGYAVSPDGKRFLILRPDPRAIPTQINVVLNWFEELRTKAPTR